MRLHARRLVSRAGSLIQRIEVRAKHFLDNCTLCHPFSAARMLIEGKLPDPQQQLRVNAHHLEILGDQWLARNLQIGMLQKRAHGRLNGAGLRSMRPGALDQ
jgi:hypothetical protein